MSRCERCDAHGPELPSLAASALEMHRALHRPARQSLVQGLAAAFAFFGVIVAGALLAGVAMALLFA